MRAARGAVTTAMSQFVFCFFFWGGSPMLGSFDFSRERVGGWMDGWVGGFLRIITAGVFSKSSHLDARDPETLKPTGHSKYWSSSLACFPLKHSRPKRIDQMPHFYALFPVPRAETKTLPPCAPRFSKLVSERTPVRCPCEDVGPPRRTILFLAVLGCFEVPVGQKLHKLVLDALLLRAACQWLW